MGTAALRTSLIWHDEVMAKISLLQFPARGGAIVNYPVMFSSGGN